MPQATAPQRSAEETALGLVSQLYNCLRHCQQPSRRQHLLVKLLGEARVHDV
jgi:hypothetical protein